MRSIAADWGISAITVPRKLVGDPAFFVRPLVLPARQDMAL